jgi:type VI secretion system protein ImpC
MRFDFPFGPSRPARQDDEGSPRRILVLADLRPTDAPGDVAARPIVRVDLDSIDGLLARCAPSVLLGPETGGERIRFRSFDDFHPDALLKNTRLFGRLLDLRKRLLHPGTFAGALAELDADVVPAGTASTTPPAEVGPQAESGDVQSTLARLLGRRTANPPSLAPSPHAASAVDNLIRRIVAPDVVAPQDPRVPQFLSAVDAALADLMRSVLHDPGFQELEATWRGIQWLVSSIELDEALELHVLHVTRDELSKGAGPESGVYRRLIDREARIPGGLALSALVGCFRFGPTAEDLAVLESIGMLARAAGAPFVAEAAAGLLGSHGLAQQPDPREWEPVDPDVEARWRALRAGPAAPCLGLALPRFLLRRPYGPKSDPIEGFGFEELPGAAEHETFLWGSPAIACAAVIARALRPDPDPSEAGDIGGLPAFVLTVDGESRLEPCAEVCLGERAVDAILARGIMPLVTVKDTDVVRLIRLQSIADPPTGLLD